MAAASTAAEGVNAWLRVVDMDVSGIVNNLDGPEPCVTAAAFHCQQAAEKIVKAILVSAAIAFPKSHDIGELIRLLPLDHPLLPDVTPLARFTPFVAVFRYPGASFTDAAVEEPSFEELREWLAELRATLATVRTALLPPPA